MPPEDDALRVTFLGTAPVIPEPGRDSSCFVLGGTLLVDTGWYGALRMVALGLDPMKVGHLILTHGHQDHYLGLPQFMFYRGMRSRWGEEAAPLEILGPEEEVRELVDLARAFVTKQQSSGFWIEPEVHPLGPGDSASLDGLRLDTCRAQHPVPALSYRLTERATGRSVVFTGDTLYNPELVGLARGSSLLIHEATYVTLPPDGESYGHSSAQDAARIAAEAGVGRLLMIHYAADRAKDLVLAARAIFPNSDVARDGETVTV